MKFITRKIVNTLKNDGVSGVFAKSYLRLKYLFIRLFNSNKRNKERWKSLKDKFKGERIFIVGNGPSLNKTELYLLKDEHTMCFNRFYLMLERINWDPSFFLTVDDLVLKDLVGESDKIIPKTQYSFLPDIHFRGINIKNKLKHYENVFWINQQLGAGFSTNLPKIYPGGTVLGEAFQIVNYLGFSEIVLIGVDMNYKIHKTAKNLDKFNKNIVSQKDDDPNHFDPRYFGKDKKYHQPNEEIISTALAVLKNISIITKDLGLKVVNAGYDSKLEYFPKENLLTLLNKNEEVIEVAFNECLKKFSNFKNVEEFEKTTSYISDKELIGQKLESFYTSSEIGIDFIKKLIFSHIPLGPYDDKYYFIEREN